MGDIAEIYREAHSNGQGLGDALVSVWSVLHRSLWKEPPASRNFHHSNSARQLLPHHRCQLNCSECTRNAPGETPALPSPQYEQCPSEALSIAHTQDKWNLSVFRSVGESPSPSLLLLPGSSVCDLSLTAKTMFKLALATQQKPFPMLWGRPHQTQCLLQFYSLGLPVFWINMSWVWVS